MNNEVNNKAVFFDRDGVINDDTGHYYIHRIEDMKINPGVAETMRVLTEKGYLLIIISNQGGIAREKYTKEDTEKFHKELVRRLAEKKADIADIYYCPHHHTVEKCLCRKTEPLMLQKAMARYHIDPSSSWFIGDKESDILAGQRAGVNTILIEANSDLRQILSRIS